MRFIIADEFYQQMLEIPFHTADCYVRPGEYLHHMYIDGVKYVVAQAVFAGLVEAEARADLEAIDHLNLHKTHYEQLLVDAERYGTLEGVTLLGPIEMPLRFTALGPDRPLYAPFQLEIVGLVVPDIGDFEFNLFIAGTHMGSVELYVRNAPEVTG